MIKTIFVAGLILVVAAVWFELQSFEPAQSELSLKAETSAAAEPSLQQHSLPQSSSSIPHEPLAPETSPPAIRQSLLNWATDVAQLMEKSLRDSGAATKTFQWLTSCANTESTHDSFRALCAANAKRLALRYPADFEQDYAALERHMPIRFKEFLNKVMH